MEDLTSEQLRRKRALQRKLTTVLEEILAFGRECGAESPRLWMESESGLYLVDSNDAWEEGRGERGGLGGGRDAVVCNFDVPFGTSCGAW